MLFVSLGKTNMISFISMHGSQATVDISAHFYGQEGTPTDETPCGLWVSVPVGQLRGPLEIASSGTKGLHMKWSKPWPTLFLLMQYYFNTVQYGPKMSIFVQNGD